MFIIKEVDRQEKKVTLERSDPQIQHCIEDWFTAWQRRRKDRQAVEEPIILDSWTLDRSSLQTFCSFIFLLIEDLFHGLGMNAEPCFFSLSLQHSWKEDWRAGWHCLSFLLSTASSLHHVTVTISRYDPHWVTVTPLGNKIMTHESIVKVVFPKLYFSFLTSRKHNQSIPHKMMNKDSSKKQDNDGTAASWQWVYILWRQESRDEAAK